MSRGQNHERYHPPRRRSFLQSSVPGLYPVTPFASPAPIMGSFLHSLPLYRSLERSEVHYRRQGDGNTWKKLPCRSSRQAGIAGQQCNHQIATTWVRETSHLVNLRCFSLPLFFSFFLVDRVQE